MAPPRTSDSSASQPNDLSQRRRTPAQSRLQRLQHDLRHSQQSNNHASPSTSPLTSATTSAARPTFDRPKPNLAARLTAAAAGHKRAASAVEERDDYVTGGNKTTTVKRSRIHSETQPPRNASNDSISRSSSRSRHSSSTRPSDQQILAPAPTPLTPSSPPPRLFDSIYTFARTIAKSMTAPFKSATTLSTSSSLGGGGAATPEASHSAHREPRTPANNRLHELRQHLKQLQDEQPHTTEDDVHMASASDGKRTAAFSDDDVDGSVPMDWDECIEQAAPIVDGPDVVGRICVLDTNVLVHSMPLIAQIAAEQRRQQSLATAGNRIRFVVPYIVLTELDGLKSRRGRGGVGLGSGDDSPNSTARRAQQAIRLVHTAIRDGDWRVQAERPLRPSGPPPMLEQIRTNDDRILNCALQVRRDCGDDGATTTVCLLSNDVNLRSFALLHDLEALSVEEFGRIWRQSDGRSK